MTLSKPGDDRPCSIRPPPVATSNVVRFSAMAWWETRERGIRDLSEKANAQGCTCFAIPYVVSEPDELPIRVRIQHDSKCFIARTAAAHTN